MKSFKRLNSLLVTAALVGLGLAIAPAATAGAAAVPGALRPNSIGAAVEFANHNSGKCVDVFNNALQHGAAVREFSCHNGTNQNWLIEPVPSAPGFFALRNVNSNMCLDLNSNDISDLHNGTTIQQWDCFPDSIPSEQWRLATTTSGGPNNLNLITAERGFCLDNNPATGNQFLHLATCSGATSQMWLER